MKTSNRLFTRGLGFEQLEQKAMLAGNVIAILSGGTLQLCGDASNNVIAVHQLKSGDWEVDGLLNTKIGGQKSATFSDVSSINIQLKGGNDAVAVANGCLDGSLCIDTAAGNDAVVLLNLNLGSVYVSTGAGNDLLAAVCVNTQEAENTVSTDVTPALSTSSSATFDTGDGNDIVFMAEIHTSDFSLCTGKGIDFVGLVDVCAENCLNVDTGAGVDFLAVVHCSAESARFTGGKDPGDVMATALNDFDSKSSDYKITLNFDKLAASALGWLKSSQVTLAKSLGAMAGLPTLKL